MVSKYAEYYHVPQILASLAFLWFSRPWDHSGNKYQMRNTDSSVENRWSLLEQKGVSIYYKKRQIVVCLARIWILVCYLSCLLLFKVLGHSNLLEWLLCLDDLQFVHYLLQQRRILSLL